MVNTFIKKLQAGAPVGGSTGEVLIKNSNADFDYDWGEAVNNPGQITFGSVNNTIGGDNWVVHYQRVGKLYFGLYLTKSNGGGQQSMFGSDQASHDLTPIFDTLDHIASLLGLTVNTYYPTSLDINFFPVPGQMTQQAGAGTLVVWTGANYTSAGGTINNVAVGFLAN